MDDNLILENYGVRLKRLTHDKIELLRQWRNDPKIQQYMFYREYITPEMQESWFANLDKKCNFYFIIEYEDKEIGCVNIKDIDWEKKTGEPGIFIYDEDYLNSDLSFRASLALSDFGFYTLGLDIFIGHVLIDNKRAVRFNKALGYKKQSVDERVWSLFKEDYEINVAKLKRLIR